MEMDRHIDLDGIAAFASAGQRLWIVLAAVVLTELGLLAVGSHTIPEGGHAMKSDEHQGRLARRRESVKDMARGELQRPGIEPLCTFNWQDAEPRKLRPFRPVYHITMGECHASPHVACLVSVPTES